MPSSKLKLEILCQRGDGKTTLRVWPALAAEIGLNESIFLLQLEFLLRLPDESDYKFRSDKKWTFGSVRELQREYFSFWSKDTVNRTIASLLKQQLILEANHNRHAYDRTRWFTLNLEAIAQLESVTVSNCDRLSQIDTTLSQNATRETQIETRSTQNETTIPETTIETTTEKKKRAPRARKNSNSVSAAVAAFRDVVRRYPNQATYSMISKIVGDDPAELERWRKTITAWIACGWKPTNVAGMLEYFQRNEIPTTATAANGRGPNSRKETHHDHNKKYTSAEAREQLSKL